MDKRFLGCAAACLLLACMRAAAAPPMTVEQLAEVDRYLGEYMRGVAVTRRVRQPDGEDFSCVDIHRQPAMNNPRFNGRVEAPSPELVAMLGGNVREAEPSKICPLGSVEMRLPTREQIIARGGVKKFMAKYPEAIAQKPLTPEAPNPVGHYYAATRREIYAYGAQSTINIWKPVLASDAFSLTQLWVIGGYGYQMQTVEVGTQVFRQIYGNSEPNLFIYYTADGYANTGCYNLFCPAFVQTSSVLSIGRRIGFSTAGGLQVEKTLAWYRDPTLGHWYLFVKNADGSYTASGYYPWSLFKGGKLADYADTVNVGGEVYTPGAAKPAIPMGSGKSPAAYASGQLYRNVAYHRNVQYLDLTRVMRDYLPQLPIDGEGTNHCAYAPRFDPPTAPIFPGWGSTFWFGGAGFVGTCTQ